MISKSIHCIISCLLSLQVLFKQTPSDRKWASYIRRAQDRGRANESRDLTLNQPVEHLANSVVSYHYSSI